MKYIIVVLLLLVGFSCTAENIKNSDHFEGVWAIDEEKGKSIRHFLIVQAIEDSYLIIDIGLGYDDGTVATRGFGKRKSRDEIKVELWNTKYTIKWESDENGEWLAMYLTPKDEEYPVYDRVETFSLDKF